MKKAVLLFASIIMICVLTVSCGSHRVSSRQSSTTYYQGENPERQREWKRCAVCDGKGSCNACKGTGRISGDACRSCKGSGKCNTCKGNGGYYIDD